MRGWMNMKISRWKASRSYCMIKVPKRSRKEFRIFVVPVLMSMGYVDDYRNDEVGARYYLQNKEQIDYLEGHSNIEIWRASDKQDILNK